VALRPCRRSVGADSELRRYGFHGIRATATSAERIVEYLGRDAGGDPPGSSAHLGRAGASLCSVGRDAGAFDTSIGTDAASRASSMARARGDVGTPASCSTDPGAGGWDGGTSPGVALPQEGLLGLSGPPRDEIRDWRRRAAALETPGPAMALEDSGIPRPQGHRGPTAAGGGMGPPSAFGALAEETRPSLRGRVLGNLEVSWESGLTMGAKPAAGPRAQPGSAADGSDGPGRGHPADEKAAQIAREVAGLARGGR